jgi:hypothetical protein
MRAVARRELGDFGLRIEGRMLDARYWMPDVIRYLVSSI